MRAAVLHELRTVPVFGDFKEPQPNQTHQVAEVLLGGLNPVDLSIAAGEYGDVELPCVVGREGIARLSDGAFYGPPLEAALSATAQGARVVTVGASAADSAAIPVRDLIGRTLIGHSNGHASLEVRREAYERLAGHAAAGKIRVEVERLPLSRIADAWEMQARGPHRKIALVP
jgi:D-arabinose 1-dehydrogenase-like Zn-dependent alcohol dehydrogenase